MDQLLPNCPRIVVVEDKHANHQTTTTANLLSVLLILDDCILRLQSWDD